MKDLAKSKSLDAITRLDLLGQGSGMTAVRANEILLERAWGKPKQEIDLDAKNRLGGLIIHLPPLKSPEG